MQVGMRVHMSLYVLRVHINEVTVCRYMSLYAGTH